MNSAFHLLSPPIQIPSQAAFLLSPVLHLTFSAHSETPSRKSLTASVMSSPMSLMASPMSPSKSLDSAEVAAGLAAVVVEGCSLVA
ncbi:hypothetical protein IG631_08736 [Alternaria alternata]|nr:hypothetical protein IG631_08736 [Alternaria alternata]